ncbi:MAG: T9SS type A sorting domain-containing protein, partial [Saprospiraceae bacterium]|nr:T9SS type A sorting domain-containing protein [Saprospiraceae bacterium]
ESIDVPQTVSFSWAESAYAEEYQITVWDPSQPNVLLVDETVEVTNYSAVFELAQNLAWQVVALGPCGMAEANQTFAFRTIGNLAFNLNTSAITACLNDDASLVLNVGNGYFEPAAITYNVEPAADIDFTFDQDLTDVQPGQPVNVDVSFPLGLNTGTYTLLFMIDDGVHTSQAQMSINLVSAPVSFNLINPPNEELGTSATPAFDWASSEYASAYTLEVAKDADFADVVINQNTNLTNFTPTTDLDGNTTFYWRVKAGGFCGSNTSVPFNFTTLVSGTHQVDEGKISISPNPVDDLVLIEWDGAFSGDRSLRLLQLNGKSVKEEVIRTGQMEVFIDVSGLPAGIYFLELLNQENRILEKLIVH